MFGAKKVIAVIDDDEMLLKTLGRSLSALGYQTQLYGSAEEFIDAARKSEAVCLIVDIHLGDLSGIELSRQISAMGYTFPVIFITGSNDSLLRKQAIELGCIAYLQKPISISQLEEAITKAIG